MSIARNSFSLGNEVRRTALLAGPLIVEQVTSYGTSVVNTVMAGRLGSLELGAVAVGSSIFGAGLMFTAGTMMAVSATVSQLVGAGHKHRVGEQTRQSLWLAAMISALLWFLIRQGDLVMGMIGVSPKVAAVATGYLRAISWGIPALTGLFVLRFFSEGIGYTRPTMYIGLFGIALNIPLNYVCMFGKLGLPQLGAVGCGWATAIVFWLQLLALTGWIGWRGHYRPFALFGRFSAPNWRAIRDLARLGVPIGVTIFLEGSLFVGSALLIGTLGSVPVAAHQVAVNFAGLMFMVPLGISGAITVRVGHAAGRGDGPGVFCAGITGIGLALSFGVFSLTAMLLFPKLIVGFYTSDPEVSRLAVRLLFLAAVFQLADCIQVSSAGALRGLKDTRMPMLYCLLAYWAVGMSLGWWLTFVRGWGPAGMWCGIIAGLSVAALLLSSRFLRTAGGFRQLSRASATG